jgi:hypothetical protein
MCDHAGRWTRLIYYHECVVATERVGTHYCRASRQAPPREPRSRISGSRGGERVRETVSVSCAVDGSCRSYTSVTRVMTSVVARVVGSLATSTIGLRALNLRFGRVYFASVRRAF